MATYAEDSINLLYMEDGFVPTYTLFMRILGVIIVIIGPALLYIIVYHSGKVGKGYQIALLVHQSL